MREILKKKYWLVGIGLVVIGFISGGFSSIAMQALAQVKALDQIQIENPIARTLLAKFFPNPNLLVEDQVEISCEPEFSVKAFTASQLVKANFTVKDAKTGAVLYGPKLVDKINPLWQKVWLGPLSSIPPKIHVVMDAQTPDGQLVSHKLIVEPDCKRPGSIITKQVRILWPKGKILINPFPPLRPVPPGFPPPPPTIPPQEPPITPIDTPHFDIPITVAVPREAIGQNLIAVVVWKNPETGVRQYLGASELVDIPIEIVPLTLHSVSPVPNASFFDIFVEISVGKPNEDISQFIADVMEKVGKDGVVTVEESRSNLFSTFDEFYIWSEPLRVINAAPLESRCPLDDDCDGVFSSDNCPAAVNPDQTDSDRDGLGDVCDRCPSDSSLDQDSDRDGCPLIQINSTIGGIAVPLEGSATLTAP